MSTKTKLFSASLILAAGLMTTGIGQALAAQDTTFVMGRDAGPGDNRCWGEAASALAQSAKAGMGRHSKAAAAPETSFRDSTFINPDQTSLQPRLGVKGATEGPPHNTETTVADISRGGLAVHALNNANAFTQLVNPVTGGLPDEDGDLLTSARCTSVGTDFLPNGDDDVTGLQ
jgi:hypothetical protein